MTVGFISMYVCVYMYIHTYRFSIKEFPGSERSIVLSLPSSARGDIEIEIEIENLDIEIENLDTEIENLDIEIENFPVAFYCVVFAFVCQRPKYVRGVDDFFFGDEVAFYCAVFAFVCQRPAGDHVSEG